MGPSAKYPDVDTQTNYFITKHHNEIAILLTFEYLGNKSMNLEIWITQIDIIQIHLHNDIFYLKPVAACQPWPGLNCADHAYIKSSRNKWKKI
jgi:hypothetical protein